MPTIYKKLHRKQKAFQFNKDVHKTRSNIWRLKLDEFKLEINRKFLTMRALGNGNSLLNIVVTSAS